jgi:hypothetical protein
MLENRSLSILEEPLAPPWFGRCPTCRRWFVFRQVRQHSDSLSRTVQMWRCQRCGYEETFADQHPPHAI